jgi:hypothetical protein
MDSTKILSASSLLNAQHIPSSVGTFDGIIKKQLIDSKFTQRGRQSMTSRPLGEGYQGFRDNSTRCDNSTRALLLKSVMMRGSVKNYQKLNYFYYIYGRPLTIYLSF